MSEPSTDQHRILSLVQRGLRDVANGDLVDDSEVWADIEDLLNLARSAGAKLNRIDTLGD
jgi:hypothetical protein